MVYLIMNYNRHQNKFDPHGIYHLNLCSEKKNKD